MTSNTPTATTFWDALRNMGALQHLELSGVLPFVDSAQADIPGGKVHLPKLLYLKIRGNPNQIVWLLNGVVLRLDPLLDIRCEGSDARSCVVALRALSATLKAVIWHMEIIQPDVNGYAWLANYKYMVLAPRQFVCAYPEYPSLLDSHVRFSITVDHPVPDNPQPLDDLWTTIFRELSLSKIRYARMQLRAPLSPDLLAATLGALPELDNLAVADHSATNIFRALQQDPPVFPVLFRLGLSHNFCSIIQQQPRLDHTLVHL
ncbi:hypothetical protein D9613_001503 [Agrocybe pediades]|uniref:Uncharacterized protein n=1 Tax=Agrocybe pediades TaxID=84607 RepID=A0A8H4R6V2_9AGAR|nr:hypothetical protein D9613_001503 [Agrocybe pediades]